MANEKKSLAMQMFGKPEKMLDYDEYVELEKAKHRKTYMARLRKIEKMSDEEREDFLVREKRKRIEYYGSRSETRIEYDKKYRRAYNREYKKTSRK